MDWLAACIAPRVVGAVLVVFLWRGIDSAGTTCRVVLRQAGNRFLGSLKGLQIRAKKRQFAMIDLDSLVQQNAVCSEKDKFAERRSQRIKTFQFF